MTSNPLTAVAPNFQGLLGMSERFISHDGFKGHGISIPINLVDLLYIYIYFEMMLVKVT